MYMYICIYIILVEYLEYELETEVYMFRRSHACMHTCTYLLHMYSYVIYIIPREGERYIGKVM